MKTELIQMKKDRKGKSYFMSGQVKHPKDNPDDYTIEIKKRGGDLFIVVGERGIYLLDRELLYKCAEKEWVRYLEKYRTSKRKGSRTKGDTARHPIVIYEDTVREVLREEEYDPHYRCRFIDLIPDKPKSEDEAREILNKIDKILQKARTSAGV